MLFLVPLIEVLLYFFNVFGFQVLSGYFFNVLSGYFFNVL
jgi:hypothetical protein